MKYLNRGLIEGNYYAICQSEKKYFEEMQRLHVKHPNPWISEGANATTHQLTKLGDGDRVSIVCVKHNSKLSGCQIAALLVHEAVHVWQAYCEGIGEERPGHEIEAYAIQRISQELINSYRPKIIK